jgi:hypothetical protein
LIRGHLHRRPGKDSVPAPAELGEWTKNQAAAVPFVHRNSVPSIQIRCRMTASLRATATLAFVAPTRCISRTPHAFSGDQRSTLVSSTDAQYTRAREALAEFWADEILEIADDATNDWMGRQRQNGSIETVVNKEHIERSRQRITPGNGFCLKHCPRSTATNRQVHCGLGSGLSGGCGEV